jgi:hypothetical protein
MQLLAEVSAFLDGLRTAAAAHPMVQAEHVAGLDENGTHMRMAVISSNLDCWCCCLGCANHMHVIGAAVGLHCRRLWLFSMQRRRRCCQERGLP